MHGCRNPLFRRLMVVTTLCPSYGLFPVNNIKSSATGLMQPTKGAVAMANKSTPAGVHFEHSEMKDAAKNIQCGTLYLDIAKNKLAGVDASFRTGPGYSKVIAVCEKCLKEDRSHPMIALHKIHK